MKILFIQKEGGIFGAEQFQLRTIPALLKLGFEIEFVRLYTNYQLGKDSPFVLALQQLGVRVFQINIGRVPGIFDVLALYRIVVRGKYDILHTHLIHADFYGALIKFIFRVKPKLVSTKHGYEETYNNEHGFDPVHIKKGVYYYITKFSETIANRSFAISVGLQRFFIQTGMAEEKKMQRIHYGFDMQVNIGDTIDPSLRFSKRQLILAGRLVGFKGHRFAISAIEILKDKFPNIVLLIVGIGELENELKKSVVDLKLENHIKFLGFRSDIQQLMSNSDLVLIPSIAEGFGVVFLEAINQQVPIAAFNVPAGNEIVGDLYKPFLAKPFDVHDLAERITFILENPESLKPAIIEAKERLNQYFTIDRMAREISFFYQNTLK